MDEKTIARFWKKVDKSGACWLWIASCGRNGYGQFGVGGQGGTMVGAHRVSWEITNGPVPEGLCVLHRCDVKKCVNPEHLFLGTHADNVNDKMKKGRYGSRAARASRGEANGNVKLTTGAVEEIRSLRGLPQRTIAKRFGVCKTTVGAILRGETWALRRLLERT